MKNKLKMYMLVASLFMCCGVIGFGIYAATLGVTIPGALGYYGSNVISVAMAVEDVAEYNGSTQIGKITKTYSETFTNDSSTLKLGASISDLYFYNDGTVNKDMVFKVTVGNVSTSKRLVTLNAPTSLPSGVTVSTASHFVTFPLKTYMNAGDSKTFMFGLTYSGSGKYQLSAGTVNLTATTDSSNASTLFQHETNVGWYIPLGTNPYSGYNEPLRWLPFASMSGIATSSTDNTPYDGHTMSTVSATGCPTINQSFYLTSEYALDPSADSATMPRTMSMPVGSSYTNFEPAYYNGSSWITVTDEDQYDYSVCNVRAYLTGSRTAYYGVDDSVWYNHVGLIGTELIPFEQQFNVKNSKAYKYIVSRSQLSLYNNILSYSTGQSHSYATNDSDDTFVSRTILGISTNTNDNFWIRSYHEYPTTGCHIEQDDEISLNGKSYKHSWYRSYTAHHTNPWNVTGIFFNSGLEDSALGLKVSVQIKATV